MARFWLKWSASSMSSSAMAVRERATARWPGLLRVRPLPRLSPRLAFVARASFWGTLIVANFVLLAIAWRGILFAPPPPDWQGLVDAATRISQGQDPYAYQEFAFRWSPLAAWLLVPFAAAGLVVWQALHVAALAALPRKLAVLALACFAFWVDVGMGNVVVFGFVLAYLAMSRGRGFVIAFTVFALLLPRPLYVPLLVYLFMTRTQDRRAMVATAVVVAALTIATGWLPSWLTVLAASGGDIANATNMAPSRLVGLAWLPIAWLIAFAAYRRGKVGLASLFASPYWLPYYFLMPLLDLVPIARPTSRPQPPCS
jgi:hypothetical protein